MYAGVYENKHYIELTLNYGFHKMLPIALAKAAYQHAKGILLPGNRHHFVKHWLQVDLCDEKQILNQ